MKNLILTVILLSFFSNAFADSNSIPEKDLSRFLKQEYHIYVLNDLKDYGYEFTKPIEKDTISAIPKIQRPKSCFSLSLDTIILPGIQFGYGWIIYDSTYTSEEFVTIHANTLGKITAIGIYLQKTKFKNTERVGWFGFWKLGIDYSKTRVTYLFADPGGATSPSKNKQMIFPIISAGLGYSWKAGNNSFFRITGDVGIKLLLANITFSYVF